MNCFLIAEHGVPMVLVVLGILFLVFSGSFAHRKRYRSCERGAWGGWGWVWIAVLILPAIALFNGERSRTFEFRGDLPTQWDRDSRVTDQRDKARDQRAKDQRAPTTMIAVSGQNTVVLTAASPPAPGLIEWPPASRAEEPQPVAADEIVLADAKDKPQEKTPQNDAPTTTTSKVRPAWIDAAPGKRDGVYESRASSGPWSTETECEKALNQDLQRVVTNYLNDLRSDDADGGHDVPLSYIKKNVVKETYKEIVDSPTVGPMLQLHARLEFSPQVQQEMQDRSRSRGVAQRLEILSVLATLVFAGLGTLFGFLKFDAYTQGKYRWRVGLATGAVVVAALIALAHA